MKKMEVENEKYSEGERMGNGRVKRVKGWTEEGR